MSDMFSLAPLAKCSCAIPHWVSWHFICSRNDKRWVPLGFTLLCWDFHTIRHVNMKQQLGWREPIKIAASHCKQAAWKRRGVTYLMQGGTDFLSSQSSGVFLRPSTFSQRAKWVSCPCKFWLGEWGGGQIAPALLLSRSFLVGPWYPWLLTGRSDN